MLSKLQQHMLMPDSPFSQTYALTQNTVQYLSILFAQLGSWACWLKLMGRIQFSAEGTGGPYDHATEICSSDKGKAPYSSFIVAFMDCFSYKGVVAHPVLANTFARHTQYSRRTPRYWMVLYSAMYLNMQKEVTRAARPSLCGDMNKGHQLDDGSAPLASPLKTLFKKKACVTSREVSTVDALLL